MATSTELIQIVIDAKDNASSTIKGIGGSLEAAKGASTAFAVAIGGAATAVAGMAIKGAAQFEKFEATLTTMLGSSEAAKNRLQELSDIAAKTPFELPQVVALGNQLQAVGKYSKETVVNLGDLAAAAGKPIEQVAGAFSKLASGQKGVAVDMFRDLLITTNDWSEATGKGISKTGELMATTEEMLAALPKILDKKKFTGMMDELSGTLEGKWSNVMDAMNSKFRELGVKLLPIIKPALDAIIEALGKIDFEKIFKWLAEHKEVLIVVGGIIAGILVGAFVALAAAIWSAVVALAPFIAVGAAIGLIIAGIVKYGPAIAEFFSGLVNSVREAVNTVVERLTSLYENFMAKWNLIKDVVLLAWGMIKDYVITEWTQLKDRVQTGLEELRVFWETIWTNIATFINIVWTGIKNAVLTAFNWMVGQFNNARTTLSNIWSGMWNSIGNVVTSAWDAVKSSVVSGINFIIDKINSAIRAINNVAKTGGEALGISVPQIGEIPRLAKGGIVTRPTLAMIGEGTEPEAVVPLSRLGSVGGVGGGIVINITGTFMSEDAAEKMGDLLIKRLNAQARV